jgi:hypothetical protein
MRDRKHHGFNALLLGLASNGSVIPAVDSICTQNFDPGSPENGKQKEKE